MDGLLELLLTSIFWKNNEFIGVSMTFVCIITTF